MLPVAFLLHVTVQGQALQPFTLTGTVKGMPTGTIYLSYPVSEDQYQQDSAVLQNGRFTIKGALPGPVSGVIYRDKNLIMSPTADLMNVFLQPGQMTVTLEKGHFPEGHLQGSAPQEELDALEKERAPVNRQLRPLSIAFDEGNNAYIAAMRAKKDEAFLKPLKASLDSIKENMEPFYEAMDQVDSSFISQHPASYVSAYLLRYKVSGMPLRQGEAAYAKLSPDIRQSLYGKAIRTELDGLRKGSPGSVAYTFTKTDINGQELSLAALKGKYVLLDFWASWCGPCRKGNPHLKNLYHQYKDKGLEIIGISDDDRAAAAWKKAVAEDGIGIWKHVLRGLDMDKRRTGQPNPEDISDHYGIHSLPTKILIDPNGNIIGRYGGGGEDDDAMDKKLAALFGPGHNSKED
ncbi:AhpC/TSA family protein [Chitinophaga agrisoli]|uniref:AhpC/TSA family protein n=2 Tax=Chitinophaga agrisoli TaxID=2607653 RepID=A0A5B2VP44_9BACT|nr:AhpC/TSA family protein [Chitinophaga agrisoli]